MNSPENKSSSPEQNNIAPVQVKTSLVDGIKSLFVNFGPEEEAKAKEYLEKNPEEVKTEDGIKPEQKTKQKQQGQKLKELEQAIYSSGTPILGATVLQYAQEAANQIGSNDELPSFHQAFFKNLSTINVTEDQALPYARYVAQTAVARSSDKASEAKHKTQIALEVFVGETGDASSYNTLLKQVVRTIAKTHGGRNSEYARYLQSAEFKTLCQAYNLSTEQQTELSQVLATETEEFETLSGTHNLKQNKDSLLAGINDQTERVRLDVMALCLSPEQIRTLLKTVDQDSVEGGYGVWSEKKKKLYYPQANKDFYTNSKINRWIDDYLVEANLPGVNKSTMRKQILDYYLNLRNEIYTVKLKKFPRSLYMAEQTFDAWISMFEEDEVVTVLMLDAYDPFLYTEYFKGKTVESIKKHDQVEKLLAAGRNKERLEINDNQIYQDILREVHTTFLMRMSQFEGDENFKQAAQRIHPAIMKMKQHSWSKRPTSFGNIVDDVGKQIKEGADIIFKYRKTEERSERGYEHSAPTAFYDTTLAHMTAVDPKVMEEVGQAFQGFNEFVKVVEGSADPKEIVSRASELKNELWDTVAEQAPIAIVAQQSYLRIFRQFLAANNNVIAPDMFSKSSYVKGEIDKLLEMQIKLAYPSMSDTEKDVYLRLGKGMAMASGDFLQTLAYAQPPMHAAFEKLPENIVRKIMFPQKGERLSMAEVEIFHETLESEFRDFPFRSLLLALNSPKYLFMWIGHNNYHAFNLGYVPHCPGKEALDPYEAWRASQALILTDYFGFDDESAKYLDGKYNNQVMFLEELTSTISKVQRGGVRTMIRELLEEDFVISAERVAGLRVLDGEKSFQKLMHKSPMLAYYFLNEESSHNTIKAKWEPNDKDKEKDKEKKKGKKKDKEKEEKLKKKVIPSDALKERLTLELYSYMHIHYPSFFQSMGSRRCFHREELNFIDKVRDNIHANLTKQADNQSGYWLLLNREERDIAITRLADPHPVSDKYLHENILATHQINKRLVLISQEVETYIQRYTKHNKPLGGRALSFADFIANPTPGYGEGNCESKRSVYEATMQAIDNISGLNNLSPHDREKIFDLFIQYNREVYYGEDSIYQTKKFTGTDGKKRKIDQHYQYCVTKKLIAHGFDNAYLDQSDLNYSATGVNMTGRNLGDFQKILEHTSSYMGHYGVIQNAISQPGQSVEIIKRDLDSISKKVFEISTTHGSLAWKAGWMVNAFLTSPFIPSRWKDIPGAAQLPIFETWATLFNPNDTYKQGSWKGQQRKEVLDHALSKVQEEAILNPMHSNKKVKKLKDKFDDNIPFFGGKRIPKILQRFFREVAELDDKDYTVNNFKKFFKTESWWLGGKENFGVGLNVLLTIIIVGFLLMLLQAIKEGSKEAEIK